MIPVLSCFSLSQTPVLTVSLQRSLTSCVIVNVFVFSPTLVPHPSSHLLPSPPQHCSSAIRPSRKGKDLKTTNCDLCGFLTLIIPLKALGWNREVAEVSWQLLQGQWRLWSIFSPTSLVFTIVLLTTAFPSDLQFHCLTFFSFTFLWSVPFITVYPNAFLRNGIRYDTLSLHFMSIFFLCVSLNTEYCGLKPSIHHSILELL